MHGLLLAVVLLSALRRFYTVLLLVPRFSSERSLDTATADNILEAYKTVKTSIGLVFTTDGTDKLSFAQLIPLLAQP